jgi:hypothetical protein
MELKIAAGARLNCLHSGYIPTIILILEYNTLYFPRLSYLRQFTLQKYQSYCVFIAQMAVMQGKTKG